MCSLHWTVICGNIQGGMKKQSMEKMQVSLFVSAFTSRSHSWHTFVNRRLCPTVALNKGDFWTQISWNTWRWKIKGILVNNFHPCYVPSLLPLPSRTCGITNWDLPLAGLNWLIYILKKTRKTYQGRGRTASACCSAVGRQGRSNLKQDCPPRIKERLWIGAQLQYKLLYFYI